MDASERDAALRLMAEADEDQRDGLLDQAHVKFAQAKDILEALLERNGQTRHALEDLSIILRRLCNVDLARGRPDAADLHRRRKLGVDGKILA